VSTGTNFYFGSESGADLNTTPGYIGKYSNTMCIYADYCQ
jgi:hypothetical protein